MRPMARPCVPSSRGTYLFLFCLVALQDSSRSALLDGRWGSDPLEGARYGARYGFSFEPVSGSLVNVSFLRSAESVFPPAVSSVPPPSPAPPDFWGAENHFGDGPQEPSATALPQGGRSGAVACLNVMLRNAKSLMVGAFVLAALAAHMYPLYLGFKPRRSDEQRSLLGSLLLIHVCLHEALQMRDLLRYHGALSEPSFHASSSHAFEAPLASTATWPSDDTVPQESRDGIETPLGLPQLTIVKSYAAPEVLDEIDSLQGYVAALAHHDIRAAAPLHVAAAFDLVAVVPLIGSISWTR